MKENIILGLVGLVMLGVGGWLIFANIDRGGAGIEVAGDQYNQNADESIALPVEQAPPVEQIISTSTTDNKTENNAKIMTATLHTSMGDITIEFNPETPNTAANFVKLAESGFYDGTKFHRVIAGFMSQGGDPLSKDDSKMQMWGTGGPGYKFADEITASNSNDIGTIAMANSGPNTNGSQFFINAANNSFLNTKHTVFGKVVAGLDVAAAINAVPVGPNDRPIEAVVIKSVTLK